MHDLLEGVCKRTIALMLYEIIVHKKIITFEIFNLKMKYFNYDFESKNKPPLIYFENIKNKQIRLSTSEMLCLCRYLSIILGTVIPKDNMHWQCYLLLREIVSLVTSFSINFQIIDHIKEKIIEHHKLFLSLSDNGQFTPKFHFLLHLPYIMSQTGPPIHLWTMRYESKHRQLKSNANVVSSRINISKTLALKCQLQICETFIHNRGFEKDINTGCLNSLPNINDSSLDENVKLLLIKNGFLENIVQSSSITYCGTIYKKGNIILTFVEENYKPTFGKIIDVFLDKSKNVAFLINKIATVYFDRHLMSYKIIILPQTDLFLLKDLSYVYPLLYTVIENESYVTLRYAVILQNEKLLLC